MWYWLMSALTEMIPMEKARVASQLEEFYEGNIFEYRYIKRR